MHPDLPISAQAISDHIDALFRSGKIKKVSRRKLELDIIAKKSKIS